MEESMKKLCDTIKELTQMRKGLVEYRKDLEEHSKEFEEYRKDFEEHRKQMWSLSKEFEEYRKLMGRFSKEFEEDSKDFEEHSKEVEEDSKNFEEHRKYLEEHSKEFEEHSKEFEEDRRKWKDYRGNILNALDVVKAINILHFDFIDQEIITKMEKNMQEISQLDKIMEGMSIKDFILEEESVGLERIQRFTDLVDTRIDELDDVRLAVWEKLKRGKCNAILSVRKLCSDPSIKVVATTETIQKCFTGLTSVVKEDDRKTREIIDNSNLSSLREPLIESDVLKASNFQDDCLDLVTMAVSITTEVKTSGLFEFKAVLISDTNCDVIPAELQGGYVHFPLRPTKHIFVISTEKWELHRIDRDEFIYKNADFKDLLVTFPPCSVSKECEIEIQVLPPSQIEILERQDGDNVRDILIVSPGIWVKHNDMLTFQKPVVISLPLLPSTDDKTELCLFKWTENDEVSISDTELIVKNAICEFTVNGFSCYCLGKQKGKRKRHRRNISFCGRKSVKRGMLKECIILVFADRSVASTLWVEMVESENKEARLKERSTQELIPITNTESGPIRIRYGQKLSVQAGGNIRVADHIQKSYLEITYNSNRDGNRLRFDVDILEAHKPAVLDFQLGNKQIHVCPFNAYRWLTQQNETSRLDKNHDGIYKNQVLLLKSLTVLAEQIPLNQVAALGIELNVSDLEINNLMKLGNKGFDLTREVLLLWRRRCNKQEIVMINELASALNEVSLNKLGSTVLGASRSNRPLKRDEFKENK